MSALAAKSTPDVRPVASRLVFVDGVWDVARSANGGLPSDSLRAEGDAYVLRIAPQACLVTEPVELAFHHDAPADVAVNLRIEVGANASLTLLETHEGKSAATQRVMIQVSLAEQAKLMHQKIIMSLPQAVQETQTDVVVAAGAYYCHFALMKDVGTARASLDVRLAGELAQAELKGVMLLRGRQDVAADLRIRHAAPNGVSRQFYKIIATAQAKAAFQGLTKVATGAQKTEGKQLCRGLLLSDQAQIDARPQLEIDADDVACSHGCSIGDMDADAMFYLRSRGLDEKAARGLLLRAFADEVVDLLSSDEQRARMHNLIEEWMRHED